jgi:hypothetical protein
MRRSSYAVAVAVLLTFAAHARVVSYAPYSDRASTPGIQHRMNRHFVVYEQANASIAAGQVILYDSRGDEEPRVIFPATGSTAVSVLAAREDEGQPAQILVNSVSPVSSWQLSNDGGATWKTLSDMASVYLNSYYQLPDVGGPFVHGRGANVRIGTREVPFVVATASGNGTFAIRAISADGTAKVLATVNLSSGYNVMVGSDREGRRFIVRDGADLVVIDAVTGVKSPLSTFSSRGFLEGWLAADGSAIVEQTVGYADDSLWFVKNGASTFIAGTAPHSTPVMSPLPPIGVSTVQFFAVPTADYQGAWIINRNPGQPTILSLYTQARGLEKQWSDVSGPEVEALHAAASGKKVLIQVHRGRQTIDALLFKDPALAVWKVGDPAPRFYDELFLSETSTKGFVHLDVDKIEDGTPFVFDSGIPQQGGGPLLSPSIPTAGGGSDVVQEWGVVRASLAQKLVLPGVGRTPGAYGSFWMTDVTLYNPSDAPVGVDIEYRPSGEVTTADLKSVRVILAAREVRTVVDSLKTLFKNDVGVGAYFISPDPGTGVNVTSRTYTTSSKGTYGYGMNGIDVFAAAGPRFPVTFSGAFQGSDFRTNAILTDVSGRGSEAAFAASGPFGAIGISSFATRAPSHGVMQINGVGPSLGLTSGSIGSLTVQPRSGEAIASVFTVDNRTNDPTFFPPDLSASVVRVIPAVGHLDGANNSRFRSDLYLFNNSPQAKQLNIQLRMWDGSGPTNLGFTLLPNEARVIPDVLSTAFGKSGIGRLRIWSLGSATDTSVRVTSRTYTIDENGGTYGFLMPPLNSFQEAAPGETLEMIGPALDKRFRTNLGLVDISAFSGVAASARIEILDDFGKSLDRFDVTLPLLGGTQINDLFHARGLPDSGAPVVIRVTVLSGMIGAYAATNDNGTNDPTYVAANLAARQ